MRRAVGCLLNRMDPDRNGQPWFAVEVADYRPTRLRHEIWDYGDTGGRFLEALILARQMIPAAPEMVEGEARIRRFVYSLQDEQGVIWNPDQKAADHMFAQGSALYGLVTDFEARGDQETRVRIERLINGLNSLAVQERDYLWFPQVATKIAPCSHQAAYQVLPVVRFYELTGYKPALEYATRLARWPLDHDSTVTEDGVITKTFWEGHLHAWMDTFSGIIRCARAGGGLDANRIMARSRRLYEWVRQNHTSPFGWVADSVGSTTCETDTITSFIRLALELVKSGEHTYWNDVERFVRNQLVENQFGDVRNLHIGDALVAAGTAGAFESYANPNTLLAVEKGDIEGCCINGGMRGLFLASEHGIEDAPEGIRVNLLLSLSAPNLEVVSYMPYEGRLDLLPTTGRTILLRCPDWCPLSTIEVDSSTPPGVEPIDSIHRLRLTRVRPYSKIIVRWTMPENEREYTVAGKSYRVRWRGDTVVAMSPAGEPYPIFQRAAYGAHRAPRTESPGSCPVSPTYW
jgi:hypothetical protein